MIVHTVKRQIQRRIGIGFNRLETLWFDFKFGTFTRGIVSAEQLGLQDDNGPMTAYQAVNERHLRAVLKTIPFPRDSIFVDIGCGRGKALLIAAAFDFIVQATGIELSPALCQDALRNVNKFPAGMGLKKKIKII